MKNYLFAIAWTAVEVLYLFCGAVHIYDHRVGLGAIFMLVGVAFCGINIFLHGQYQCEADLWEDMTFLQEREERLQKIAEDTRSLLNEAEKRNADADNLLKKARECLEASDIMTGNTIVGVVEIPEGWQCPNCGCQSFTRVPGGVACACCGEAVSFLPFRMEREGQDGKEERPVR